MHIAALIIGVLAILSSAAPFSGVVLGIVAIILGVLGRRKLLEEGRSAGAAIGGIITGVIGLVAGLGFTVSCLLCGACFSAAADQAEQQNQALAEQMANAMANSMGAGLTPTDPATGMPATGMPAIGDPGAAMPAAGGMVSAGGPIAVGMPTAGFVGPGMPSTPQGRPYIDYFLTVTTPGTYQIDLMSPDSGAYDPYLYLLQNGVEMASNDDGGGYPNSRISQALAPGLYTVRVSSFRSNIPAPAAYTLNVTQTM